jgi:hypothetical protein
MAAGLCYGSRGGGAALAFHHQVGAYNTQTLIGALGQLRRFLGGQKATLVVLSGFRVGLCGSSP